MPGQEKETQRRPRRHPESAFRSVGEDGGLVVLPDRAEVKVVNPVGMKIWSLLDGEHTPEEIARAVADEYEVSEEQALRDVVDFLDELDRGGMLAADESATEESRS